MLQFHPTSIAKVNLKRSCKTSNRSSWFLHYSYFNIRFLTWQFPSSIKYCILRVNNKLKRFHCVLLVQISNQISELSQQCLNRLWWIWGAWEVGHVCLNVYVLFWNDIIMGKVFWIYFDCYYAGGKEGKRRSEWRGAP